MWPSSQYLHIKQNIEELNMINKNKVVCDDRKVCKFW